MMFIVKVMFVMEFWRERDAWFVQKINLAIYCETPRHNSPCRISCRLTLSHPRFPNP